MPCFGTVCAGELRRSPAVVIWPVGLKLKKDQWITIICGLLIAVLCSMQAALTAPLGDWKIEGPRFQSVVLNFNLVAPDNWVWSEDVAQSKPEHEQYSFISRQDARTFFRVIVRARKLFENSEKSIGEYLNGVEAANAKSGISIQRMIHRRRNSAAGNGYAYSYEMTLPQGAVALADGYVIAADRLYILQYISTDRSKLQLFERFIDSLHLIATVNK
jgi:hypothetical protein